MSVLVVDRTGELARYADEAWWRADGDDRDRRITLRERIDIALYTPGSAQGRPMRLPLIPTLVDRQSLASALAINSVVFNLARFIGPALAGLVIAEIGIAAAFAANAVGYIAFQISLLNLRGLPPQPVVGRQNVLRASTEAFSYAYRHPGIGPCYYCLW